MNFGKTTVLKCMAVADIQGLSLGYEDCEMWPLSEGVFISNVFIDVCLLILKGGSTCTVVQPNSRRGV